MKIKSIKSVGKKPVFDISVEDAEHYVLENGVVTHNTGVLYSASTVFFISKRQVKDGTELKGYDFTLKAEKSRTVKEKSTFPITVNFDGGIDPFSGLLEMATEIGFVAKPKVGWYVRAFLDEETGEMVQEEKSWRAKATDCVEFWAPLFKHKPFRDAIENKYKLGSINSIKEVDEAVDELINSKVEKFKTSKENKVTAADIENDLDQLESEDL